MAHDFSIVWYAMDPVVRLTAVVLGIGFVIGVMQNAWTNAWRGR